MKKIIVLCFVLAGILYGYDVEVKRAAVSLMINGKTQNFNPGDAPLLHAGDLVCFVQGDGRVLIRGKHYKKQLSRHTRSCKHLPTEDGKPTSFAKSIENNIVAVLTDEQEKSVNGVSRKGSKQGKFTETIHLNKETKFLALRSKRWGPLPVTFTIMDKDGKVKETLTNEEDTETTFIVTRDLVSGGCTIRVCNAFDEVLLQSKVEEK